MIKTRHVRNHQSKTILWISYEYSNHWHRRYIGSGSDPVMQGGHAGKCFSERAQIQLIVKNGKHLMHSI
jgi:hypothetical protein